MFGGFTSLGKKKQKFESRWKRHERHSSDSPEKQDSSVNNDKDLKIINVLVDDHVGSWEHSTDSNNGRSNNTYDRKKRSASPDRFNKNTNKRDNKKLESISENDDSRNEIYPRNRTMSRSNSRYQRKSNKSDEKINLKKTDKERGNRYSRNRQNDRDIKKKDREKSERERLEQIEKHNQEILREETIKNQRFGINGSRQKKEEFNAESKCSKPVKLNFNYRYPKSLDDSFSSSNDEYEKPYITEIADVGKITITYNEFIKLQTDIEAINHYIEEKEKRDKNIVEVLSKRVDSLEAEIRSSNNGKRIVGMIPVKHEFDLDPISSITDSEEGLGSCNGKEDNKINNEILKTKTLPDQKTEDQNTEDQKTEDQKTEDQKTEDQKTEDQKTEVGNEKFDLAGSYNQDDITVPDDLKDSAHLSTISPFSEPKNIKNRLSLSTTSISELSDTDNTNTADMKKIKGSLTFYPYFYDQTHYNEKDISTITDDILSIKVHLSKIIREPIILYPFGLNKNIKHIEDDVCFSFEQNYKQGYAYGHIKNTSNGGISIVFDEFILDDKEISLNKIELPIYMEYIPSEDSTNGKIEELNVEVENIETIETESESNDKVDLVNNIVVSKIEPVDEIKVEPVDEIKVEPVDEIKVEPVDEIKVEPVDEIKVEPVDETKVEPVDEIKVGIIIPLVENSNDNECLENTVSFIPIFPVESGEKKSRPIESVSPKTNISLGLPELPKIDITSTLPTFSTLPPLQINSGASSTTGTSTTVLKKSFRKQNKK